MSSSSQRSMISPDKLPVILGIITAAIFISLTRRKRTPYPPGPKGLPLLGNVLDVPGTYQWIAYEEFGRKYNSPVVHVKVLGTDIVCINDYEVARDIFEKRGSLHADRPRLVTLRDIAGHKWNFGLETPDSKWKTCRKVFDNYFKQSEIKQLRPRFTRTVQGRMLGKILSDPSNFAHYGQTYAVTQALEIAFGLSIEKDDDPFIQVVENCLETVHESGNHQLVDAFPLIRFLPGWFPGMRWKTEAPKWREYNRNMSDIPFNAVKKAIQEQTSTPSVATYLFDEDRVGDDVIRAVTFTIMAAGTDTVVSIMQCMFLYMSIFPYAQTAAQDELDRVVGPGRLPEFIDEPQLPYVKALYREIFRWACITPLAVPHQSMEDDTWNYEGKDYFIPKNSIMLGNAWAMTRDPKMYPNPHTFDPARFLDKDGKLDPKIKEADMPFGFRPRHCAGRWYAEDFLFIVIASVLHVFRIEANDKKSAGTTEWVELMKPGLISYPKPFSCKISPRSQSALDLIQQSEGQK